MIDRIITIAFGVRDEQLINLPGWTHIERFDIVARYPGAIPYNPRFTAVEEQPGLKLEPRKAPVDVLVIDHVEKPTPDWMSVLA